MHHYPDEVKESMVSKLCSPYGPSLSKLSLESGIATSTLHGWVKKYGGGQSTVKKTKQVNDWSAKDKLRVIAETFSLDEESLGAYLRQHGLHSHQVEEWKKEASAGLDTPKRGKGRPKKDPALVAAEEENKLLKRDLRRKEKALAEQTALVILKKKPNRFGETKRTTNRVTREA